MITVTAAAPTVVTTAVLTVVTTAVPTVVTTAAVVVAPSTPGTAAARPASDAHEVFLDRVERPGAYGVVPGHVEPPGAHEAVLGPAEPPYALRAGLVPGAAGPTPCSFFDARRHHPGPIPYAGRFTTPGPPPSHQDGVTRDGGGGAASAPPSTLVPVGSPSPVPASNHRSSPVGVPLLVAVLLAVTLARRRLAAAGVWALASVASVRGSARRVRRLMVHLGNGIPLLAGDPRHV